MSHLQQHNNLGIAGCIIRGFIVLLLNIGIDNDVVFTLQKISNHELS